MRCCIGLFSSALTKYPRLSNLKRKEVYLTYSLEAESPSRIVLVLMSALVTMSPHGGWHCNDGNISKKEEIT